MHDNLTSLESTVMPNSCYLDNLLQLQINQKRNSGESAYLPI